MVYNKYKKVTGIITVNVSKEKDLKTTTFILEDILDFEKGNLYEGTSFKEFTDYEQSTWEAEIGGKISITTDTGSNLSWDARNELGKEKPVRNNLNFHFENQQDRTRDFAESGGSESCT